MYRTIPVNFVGGENQSRSNYWSSQSTVNFYTDYQSSGRSPSALLPWPGEKAFSQSGTEGESRGMAFHNDYIFLVMNRNLMRIDSAGNQTNIGEILGDKRCSLASDGDNLLIRTGEQTYVYNTSLSVIGDPDLENAQTLTHINKQIIYQGTGNRFGVADAGDPTSIFGTSYASAESADDDIVQLHSFRENIVIGGSRSIEHWFGEHSEAILGELGYDADAVAKLREDGVVP